MELNSKSAHLPVPPVTGINISKFALITGKNGSGKTLLLKAIASGSIEVKGITTNEIQYFDYRSFLVDVHTESNIEDDARRDPLDDEYTSIVWHGKKADFENAVDDFFRESKNEVALIIGKFLRPAKFKTKTPTHIDIKNFEDFKSFFTLGKSPDQRQFSDLVFYVVYCLAVNGIDLRKYQLKDLIDTYYQVVHEIQDMLAIRHRDLIPYYQENLSKVKKINLHLKEISQYELQYRLGIEKYAYSKWLSDRGKSLNIVDKIVPVESPSSSPVEILNKILRTINANGYEFYYDSRGINYPSIQNFTLDVKLRKKDSTEDVDFSNLSSGEKTLVTLVILTYRLTTHVPPKLILLDEIDCFLHPKMVDSLISTLATLHNQSQINFVLASHSPSTVAKWPADSLYSLDIADADFIKPITTEDALTILTNGFASLTTSEGVAYIQLGLSGSNDKPVLFTEGICDKIIIGNAWKILYPEKHNMPFYIQDTFDAGFLGNLFARGKIFEEYKNRKFIALFDFDEQGFKSWNPKKNGSYVDFETNPHKGLVRRSKNGFGFKMLLPVPFNKKIMDQVLSEGHNTFEGESVLQIEHLFYVDGDTRNFREKRSIRGGSTVLFKGNKIQFAESSATFEKDRFQSFIPLFDMIQKIIDA